MREIVFRSTQTAADADVLNDSEIETAPGRGMYVVRAASTVSTATLAVSSPGQPIISAPRALTLRANAEIRAEDNPWVVVVAKGDRVIVALAGTTGTVSVEATYLGD